MSEAHAGFLGDGIESGRYVSPNKNGHSLIWLGSQTNLQSEQGLRVPKVVLFEQL